MFDQAEGKISKKKSEKYILLTWIEQCAVLCKIPWDFRDTCKNQKISSIFKPVMGMKKAFYKQKTENRKSCTSYIAHNTVQRICGAAYMKPGSDCRRIVAQKKRSGMVDQHDYHSQYLQAASA